MARSLVADVLHQRLERAHAVSQACTEHAIRLAQDANASREWALKVRLDAIELREREVPAPGDATIASFRVRGLVDGLPAEAHFEDGRLDCPEDVLHRAEVMVALAESLGGQPSRMVKATLDGPVGDVLVTVMRAFSRVYAFEVGTRRHPAR